ncbi:MAG: SGNH/GDSL hydrolase family protein, partial [Verrucomicrobia bacterium]|nr:SGNH/GDSL hydrolase family protein [Verrucomicrobiota bacterium]
DPYPYFSPWKMNHNEHGNLTEYDAKLGWKGTANAKTVFVSQNARVSIVHNEDGRRDIRENERSAGTPAAVFLGDSFTWGYDVDFAQIFVHRVAEAHPDLEVYNFGHRGYGTDQSLLAFEGWTPPRPLALVFLMFYENDLADNSHDIRYRKNKPRFQLNDGKLVLTNVPVPPNKVVWKKAAQTQPLERPSPRARLRVFLFKSHLVHALHRRFFNAGEQR